MHNSIKLAAACGYGAVALFLAMPLVSAQQPASSASPVPGTAAAAATRPRTGGGLPRETSFATIAAGEWRGPRLADGQPDISGHWSNTISNHSNFTDPHAGAPGDRNNTAQLGPREQRAPSRVSDPADGQVPFQPWALNKVKDFQAHFANPTQPQYIEPLARCAPGGVPKSLYWHGYEIAQYPGYVVFLFSSGTRIIYLDGRAHLPDNIKLWNGDSRGHWQGNTLVVDVTNTNGKALFARTGEFASENAHFVERYIFAADGKRYNYEAVVTDPTVYTRPWTITIPARKYSADDPPDGWNFETRLAKYSGKEAGKQVVERDERICTENNGGFGNVSVVTK